MRNGFAFMLMLLKSLYILLLNCSSSFWDIYLSVVVSWTVYISLFISIYKYLLVKRLIPALNIVHKYRLSVCMYIYIYTKCGVQRISTVITETRGNNIKCINIQRIWIVCCFFVVVVTNPLALLMNGTFSHSQFFLSRLLFDTNGEEERARERRVWQIPYIYKSIMQSDHSITQSHNIVCHKVTV